ncbi:MAG: ATPase domain-containing protein [Rhodanobacteraceae bacterium]
MSSDGSEARTGIEGLDDVLSGGLSRGNLFLLEGEPGAGKTTVAIQFLLEGARRGERCLYISLSETEDELRKTIASHGWTLPELFVIHELVPADAVLARDNEQSLLYSADLELGETTRQILETVDRVKPERVVLDSLSEIRLLAQSSLRYRRQILAVKQYFSKLSATVLFLDDLTAETGDKTVHSIAHGVIRLEEVTPDYGAGRRRLRVLKYRGQQYRGGYHDFAIKRGGVQVYPRLVALEHRVPYERTQLSAGLPPLDALLGGGVERGSSTLIIGPAGTGKSLMALTFAIAAISRGEKVALFAFDEEKALLLDRTRALGMNLEKCIEEGSLFIDQVDAAQVTPGEFAYRVRDLVDSNGISEVIIDSVNGYRAAMPEENSLILHIHELLQYLNRRGASTFMTVAQHGIVGSMDAPVDLTYLADTVILLRYFEARGEVRRAVSVIKKRAGRHETTIREFRIGEHGLRLGDPLTEFTGVLVGVPTFTGGSLPPTRGT